MKIHPSMSVTEVQARMGDAATYEEAVAMIEFLLVGVETGGSDDTAGISPDEWLELCALAAEGVARNADLAAA